MRKPSLIAALVISIAAIAWLQFSTPHLVDRDSYFHARYAQLMPQRGLSRHFDWAQESVWKDRYSDKEFLYHVFLAPFCREGHEVGGAKVANVVMGAFVLVVLALILVKLEIRAPWFWILLVPALGNHFLFRMQPARPQMLSLALALLGILFLMRDRWRAVGIVGFIYSWSYAAPHLLIAFAVIDSIARYASDGKFEWRGLAAASGGVVAGLLVHPYFPNDLSLWWVQNVQVLLQAWKLGVDADLRLGGEFNPVDARSLFISSTLVAICFLGVFLASAWRSQGLSRRSRTLIAFSVGGFLLYSMSARFVEYFAPLALIAAASVASDLWPRERSRRASLALITVATISIFLGVKSMTDSWKAVTTYPGPDLGGASKWVRDNVPPGETIVHLDFGDFVQLFYFDPTHKYLVGLDPMFMYVASPSKCRMLEDMKTGRVQIDAEALSKAFKSKWLIARSKLRRMIEYEGLRPTFSDDGAAVYKLAD